MVLAALCFLRLRSAFIGDETIAMVFLAVACVLAPVSPIHSQNNQ